MKSRTQGARQALLDAFSELARSRRYADFGVGLIASNAKVAKSTFYYHFRQKDDLLVENLRPMVVAAAQLPFASAPTPEVEAWVAHFWEHRAVARPLFARSTMRRVIDGLAEELSARLRAAAPHDAARRLAPLAAHQIAGAMFALLQAWLAGRVAAAPDDIARLLWSGARALAAGVAVSERDATSAVVDLPPVESAA